MRNASRPARHGWVNAATPRSGQLTAKIPQIIQFPLRDHLDEYFSVKVRGNSMAEAGIHEGDYILLRKAEAPIHGAVMLVQCESWSTVKRIGIWEGRVFLCWEDGSRRRIEANPADFDFQGRLVAIEQKPNRH
jgi:SOS-response transcriptional repressor LexA